jgi:hypothetical protein
MAAPMPPYRRVALSSAQMARLARLSTTGAGSPRVTTRPEIPIETHSGQSYSRQTKTEIPPIASTADATDDQPGSQTPGPTAEPALRDGSRHNDGCARCGETYFPTLDERINLELVERKTFGSRVVYLRYRRVPDVL